MDNRKFESLFKLEYAQKILALAPIAYWPLWDDAGAAAAIELNALRGGLVGNGTPSNVTFGQPGVGDGRTAASFNGTTSRVNVYSAALAAAFKGSSGSLVALAKVSGVGVWTDGAFRRIASFGVDGNNSVRLMRINTNNALRFDYISGGVAKLISLGSLSETGWFHIGITWDKTADEVKAFYKGIQTGATQSSLGVWSGSLDSTLCVIGTNATTPAQTWSGDIAHVALFDYAITPARILGLSANPI